MRRRTADVLDREEVERVNVDAIGLTSREEAEQEDKKGRQVSVHLSVCW